MRSISGIREDNIIGKQLDEMSIKKDRNIAIFVALQMEREVLINRWSLKDNYPILCWTGISRLTNFIVFGPDEPGRVRAAVSTMKFLQKFLEISDKLPDILIVLGIAGGFKNEGVNLGHVIVPKYVADLATRKVYDERENIRPEFRPVPYETDFRIGEFLKSGFNKKSWEQFVILDAEWPEGLRPAINYETIASLDEVVTSEEWVKTLCKAWPKLAGVEMEAGGVCAAAKAFGINASVIRGVSDLADPLKSDNEWRRRAMKTIASIVESIDYDRILSS